MVEVNFICSRRLYCRRVETQDLTAVATRMGMLLIANRTQPVADRDRLKEAVDYSTLARRIFSRARESVGPMLFSGMPTAELISW
jgi:hypothetical protein